MEGPLRRHLHVTPMADLHAVRRELRACVHEVCAEGARPDRSNELRAGAQKNNLDYCLDDVSQNCAKLRCGNVAIGLLAGSKSTVRIFTS
jgi:hypothetical protein